MLVKASCSGGKGKAWPITAVTLKEFASVWETNSSIVSPAWAGTRRSLLKHVLAHYGDLELEDIGPRCLWTVQRCCREKGLADATINRITHGTLAALLRDAEAVGLYNGDRTKLFNTVHRLREVVRSPRGPWTREERHKILAACPHLMGRELTSWVAWQFFTGMRPSESLALTWDDLDITRRWCRIRRSRCGAHVGPCKTSNSLREITLARPAIAAISSLERADGLVFRTPLGNPIDLRNFTARYWHPLMDELNGRVSRRDFYCTRHSFISHCLEAGVQPATVARLVGSNISTIQRAYFRWTREPDTDQVEDALLGPGPRNRLRSIN